MKVVDRPDRMRIPVSIIDTIWDRLTPAARRDTVLAVNTLGRRTPRRTATIATSIAAVLLALLVSCATPGPSPAERLRGIYPPERPFTESRFGSFGGISIHYRTWVPADQPRGKVLFLHAVGGSTVTFRLIGPALAEAGYSVLAVDLPGFGFSDLALEFEHSLGERSNLVWSLADRLDTEQNSFAPADPWVVAGHGMGGRVATQMALDRPGRTRGLLLFASDVVDPANPSRFFWLPPYRWAMRAWFENSLYTVEGVEELLTEAYGRPAGETEIDLYAAPLLRENMPHAYVNYARTAGPVDLDLAAVASPSLVVWGANDTWIEAELAGPTAAALPNAMLRIVEGAGHLPMETHVEETRDAVTSWLNGL